MSKSLELLRTNLLKDAWEASQTQGLANRCLDLQVLVALMKKRSHLHPELSSLYFAGAFEDHKYFLKTNRVAVGLAVLPEDAAKAGLWKRHPHQQEAIFVLEGSIRLIIENKPEEVVAAGSCGLSKKGSVIGFCP